MSHWDVKKTVFWGSYNPPTRSRGNPVNQLRDPDCQRRPGSPSSVAQPDGAFLPGHQQSGKHVFLPARGFSGPAVRCRGAECREKVCAPGEDGARGRASPSSFCSNSEENCSCWLFGARRVQAPLDVSVTQGNEPWQAVATREDLLTSFKGEGVPNTQQEGKNRASLGNRALTLLSVSSSPVGQIRPWHLARPVGTHHRRGDGPGGSTRGQHATLSILRLLIDWNPPTHTSFLSWVRLCFYHHIRAIQYKSRRATPAHQGFSLRKRSIERQSYQTSEFVKLPYLTQNLNGILFLSFLPY